jgi:hypothetical protein
VGSVAVADDAGEAPGAGVSDERLRHLAAAVWTMRARAEGEAAARFARLAEELTATSAVAPVIAMARGAADDELRHAALCRELVRSLGGTPPEIRPGSAEPSAPRSLALRERVLYEVVAMSCVTETLSAALLGEMVERATDEEVKATMHAILRDEIEHSRLGWAHLAAEHERGAADVIGAYLPAMLRGTVEEELFFTWGEPPEKRALAGLGALDRPARFQIFVATMQQVVFPGLARFGVDVRTGVAWLLSKLAPSSA